VSWIRDGTLISSGKAVRELSVVQGSCLSNLLFLLVMNDLQKCLKFSRDVLFVDDVTLSISGSLDDIVRTTCKLETDLTSVDTWMSKNIFELKENKSTVMIIARPFMLQSLSDLNVCFNARPMKRVYVTNI
jgi:hypothetical protein